MGRTLGRAEFLAQRRERGRLLIIAIHVMQQSRQLGERRRVEAAVLLDAVARRALSWSVVQPALATPITGTFRWPRRTMPWSAGKIFLYARSPLAPKKTRASQ